MSHAPHHYAGVAMSALRPYQLNAIAEIEKAIEEGKRRLLYVAPTGAGKTVVGAETINRAVERHHRVLVIAPARDHHADPRQANRQWR